MSDDPTKPSRANKLQYGKDRFGREFHDMSDNIGQQRRGVKSGGDRGYVLHWNHVPTGANVHFKAFLTQYSDKYTSDWNDQDVFGRMDPISSFKKTGRVITLAWDVPAASVEEAKFNLAEAEKFLAMLYPVYEDYDINSGGSNINLTDGQVDIVEEAYRAALDVGNTDAAQIFERIAREQILASKPGTSKRKVSTMVASPLFKLKFSNLIMDAGSVKINAGASESGLVGKLSGLSYEPDIEQGFFGHTEIDGVEPGVLLPQTIKFSCEFTVLHTSPVGWKNNKRSRKRTENFPYHAGRINRKR